MRKLKQRGFTLIELMITVAVIGILAAIAYPAYTSALVKNRRATAQSFLSDAAQRQQQFLMDNRAYAGTLSALGVTAPTDVAAYYTITFAVSASAPPAFTATAAPIAGSSQVSDGELSITHSGVKLPAGKW